MQRVLKCAGLLLVLSYLGLSQAQTPISAQWPIYQFVPYNHYVENGVVVDKKPPLAYWNRYGVQGIDLVYEGRLLDYPNSNHVEALINTAKVQAVAQAALAQPQTPVSLDMESWNRFNVPQTPERMLEVIQIFRTVNTQSLLGLYATAPQNSYALKGSALDAIRKLNKAYRDVAAAVDYLSPSLYNFSGHDLAAWQASAKFNIEQARLYSATKPVWAYITPEVVDKRTQVRTWLSDLEMRQRLETLKNLGYNGCIIWASSQSRDASGQPPVIDPNAGWFKGVADFAKTL